MPKSEPTLPVVVDTQKLSEEERSVIESPIAFKGVNKAEPSIEVRERLDAIVDILDKKPHVKLKIVGHTCDLGSESLNLKIGRQRSESVADYFYSKGVSQDRIIVDSKGESEPLFLNNSSENRSKNRRVDIEIIQ